MYGFTTYAQAPYSSTGAPPSALSGVLATGAVGNVALGISVSLTGNSASGAIGNVSIGASVPLVGVSASGAVGSANSANVVFLTGVSASGLLGIATTGEAINQSITGVSTAGHTGNLNAYYWGLINTGQDADWTLINT